MGYGQASIIHWHGPFFRDILSYWNCNLKVESFMLAISICSVKHFHLIWCFLSNS
ncbi:hypothetical protein BN1088_1432284 [Sphingobacterium sp. PM2-P1-29]|nr:hypothetical protein BN1088_1432284 [Sphingobacterium sp. PM2-P1-29]